MAARDDKFPGGGGGTADDLPTGRLSRFMKLSGLSAGAGTRMLGQKVRGMFQDPDARAEAMMKSHIKTAQKTVEVMGQLKGAVMKVGQMLALNNEAGILPPELTEAFGRLQHQAPRMAYPAIREQLVKELGGPPEVLFKWFDPEPMGSASLGQVHAARTRDGQEVVVKVQYPGIDQTVKSDLWQVQTLFKASGIIGRAEEADLVFKEIEARLLEELDYGLELKNLQAFADHFKDDPRILIPTPISGLSARRVLTMTRMEGVELDEILSRHPEQAWRDQLGATLFDLMMEQLMHLQAMHADPQLGNYRFLDDGRVVMLDLGCVKRLDNTFLNPYLGVLDATLRRDRQEAVACLAELGICSEADPTAHVMLHEFADLVMRPLLESPYCFADDGRLMQELKPFGPRFLARPDVRGHPDLVFLHRVYIGFYFMVARLRASGDWQAIYHRQRARRTA